MKRVLQSILLMAFSLIYAQAITVVPTTSTGGTEIWYMIKCNPRDANNPGNTWITVASDGGLVFGAFSGSDEQLWKVVPNGTGVALINKRYSSYLNADQRPPQTSGQKDANGKYAQLFNVAAMPATPLRLVQTNAYPTWIWPGWAGDGKAVMIVDNTPATTVDANNVVNFVDKVNAFTVMSIGNDGNGNPQNCLCVRTVSVNLNIAFLFRTFKDLLEEQIATCTTVANNSSSGPNPGQFSADDITGLQDAISEAQAVASNASSTDAQFLVAYNELTATLNAFNSSVILPELSDEFTQNWYCIQGTRPAGMYMTSTGDASPYPLKNTAFTMDDNQLWKLVANGNGFALQNKATGEYLDCTADRTTADSPLALSTTPDMPVKALHFLVSGETTERSKRFWIENTGSTLNFRLYSNTNGEVASSIVSSIDNCTWLFLNYAAAQREILKSKIIQANTLLAATQVGTNPGQLSDASMQALKDVVAAAQVVSQDPGKSGDDYVEAANSVATAIQAMKSSANTPVISPQDVASSTWYTFTGTRPTSYTAFLYNSSTDSVLYKSLQQNDSELWRFVANGSGYAIQNKATMKYINTDVEADAETGLSNLTTVATMPTLPIKFVISDNVANGAFRFNIVNYDATDLSEGWGNDLTFNMHAAALAPMNYLDPTDNSTWLIADAKQSVSNALNGLITEVQTFYNLTSKVEGNCYALYPSASRTNLANSLNIALAIDQKTATYQQLQDALASLNVAYSAFKASKNTDLNALFSTADSPKWFYITNDGSETQNYSLYAFGKRIAKQEGNVRAVVADNNSDSQKWRFELGEGQTFRIINKALNEEFVISGTSTIATLSADYGSGTTFEFGDHLNGYGLILSFGGTPSHSASDGAIVGWGDKNNPNSSWRIDPAIETGSKNITVNHFIIRNVDGVISVDGVKSFDLYSVMGQRLNPKLSQNKGIYLIKVGNQVQKYILK